MHGLARDIRYAFRSLRHRPGFTVVAVLSLALGIAGNATIFSVLNGLLLKPLPVGEPDRTVAIYTSDYSSTRYGASSYPDYLDFKARLTALDQVVVQDMAPSSLTTGESTQRVSLGLVSANYFSGLRIPLALGRGFAGDEDRPPAGAAVVVLGHGLWTRGFGADSGVIGRTVALGGQPFVVIGVAAPRFTGLVRGVAQEAWIPITAGPRLVPSLDLTERGNRGLFLYGHLARGATVAQAQAQATALAASLYRQYPDLWATLRGSGRPITVLPEAQARLPFPDARLPVIGVGGLLLVIVGAVLLIACANVASLLLARAVTRRRETAVRLALGASRGRLAQQFLSESVMIALTGGGLGLLVAAWVADLVAGIHVSLPLPLALDFHPDARVLGFTLLLSLAAGVLLGLIPALQSSRPNLVPALKDTAGATGRSRLRNGFVVGQALLSVVLLVLAGLFLRSLAHATAIDPGFAATDALLVTADLSVNGYDQDRSQSFEAQLLERARGLPGVKAAGYTTVMPLGVDRARSGVRIDGYTPAPGEDMEINRAIVGPGYFSAMELALVEGREFTPQDRTGAPGVVVVNHAFVRRYWPGEDPIGRVIHAWGEPWQVVGVARDGKYRTLGEDQLPFLYAPLAQRPSSRVTLVLRTAGDPAPLEPAVRALVHELDPNLPLERVATLREHLAAALLPARLAGLVIGGFGILALLLASLGVYGVVAYGVSQRRREIGIRIALGAVTRDVVRLAIGDGMRLVIMGLGGGILVAALGSRFLGGLLYGLAPLDPAAFLGAPVVFGLVALLACWLPARRAARVDPMIAFRAE
jgi:putative ABC transport system permease protein